MRLSKAPLALETMISELTKTRKFKSRIPDIDQTELRLGFILFDPNGRLLTASISGDSHRTGLLHFRGLREPEADGNSE